MAKIPLFFNARWSRLVLAIVLVAGPLFASASLFSVVGGWLNLAGPITEVGSKNSQTIALLEAPTGPEAGAVLRDVGSAPIIGNTALWTDSGPLGTLADISSTTPESDQISTYIVRAGDTVADVSRMFNVSANTISWANNLKKGQVLRQGDTLVILPISGIQYTVKKGDTLSTIAKRFGGDQDEIVSFNGLDDEASLAVGQMIIIPDGEMSTAPVPGKPVVQLPSYSSYYSSPAPGARRTQGLHGHNGVDLGGLVGTPIYAAAGGVVVISRDSGWNGGYGSYVVIKHNNGTQTLYAHMSRVDVRAGQAVGQGDRIGSMGNTGKSTGSHLHFEVRGAKNPF